MKQSQPFEGIASLKNRLWQKTPRHDRIRDRHDLKTKPVISAKGVIHVEKTFPAINNNNFPDCIYLCFDLSIVAGDDQHHDARR